MADAPAAPDAILFQEKHVFLADHLELVRAHKALCDRFLAVEKAEPGNADPAMKDLPATIDAVKTDVAGLQDEVTKLKDKVDVLFPDGEAPVGNGDQPGGVPPAKTGGDVPPADPSQPAPPPPAPAPQTVPPVVPDVPVSAPPAAPEHLHSDGTPPDSTTLPGAIVPPAEPAKPDAGQAIPPAVVNPPVVDPVPPVTGLPVTDMPPPAPQLADQHQAETPIIDVVG